VVRALAKTPGDERGKRGWRGISPFNTERAGSGVGAHLVALLGVKIGRRRLEEANAARQTTVRRIPDRQLRARYPRAWRLRCFLAASTRSFGRPLHLPFDPDHSQESVT
jgi:hypothetical protein